MEETAQLHQQTMQHFNERQRRIYAGSLAKEYGYGGITKVHKETGMDPHTIMRGMQELTEEPLFNRIRKEGGGRKKTEHHQPQIIDVIELEANPKTDKRTVVKWTSHSLAHIATAVRERGFQIAQTAVRRILINKGYALKANKKDIEGGKDHPDRDKQFQHINMQGLRMQIQGFPILSIDAKKTEKIGNMKNNGREWMPKGEETKVNVYDFGEKDTKTKKIKKAIPYGIYDILKKKGFVNVGIDTNTAEFAAHSLTTWWDTNGKMEYREATELLLFADCGSSNGNKNKLWKYCLQQFANHTGLIVHVCHYPPGTSKWNDIEHAMFSFITINWRARPLIAYEVVLELIKHTTTKTGLQIEAVLDENHYEKGRKITEEQMQSINLQGDDFHPEWNYTIKPNLN
jgi:Rhodopirellula transposase DDE domain